MKKQEEINKMAVDATHELQKLMCNCLLPDIVFCLIFLQSGS